MAFLIIPILYIKSSYKVKYRGGGDATTLLCIDRKQLWEKAKTKIYVKVNCMEIETLKVVEIVRNRVKSWVLRKIYANNILVNLK